MADISQLSDAQLISLLGDFEAEREAAMPKSGFQAGFAKATGVTNLAGFGETPKEIFDTAVSEGLLSPTFTPSEDTDPEFAQAWNAYKQEMQPSALGAAYRGATRAIIPTLGAIGGGALGSMAPIPLAGTIAGGMAGSAAGSALQESMMPMSAEERAQANFDAASAGTRYSRLAGEVVPQFMVAKVPISKIGAALAGDIQVGKALAKSAGIGAGVGAGVSIAGSAAQGELPDLERLAFDTLTGAVLEPTKLGQRLFDPRARQEIAARQAAGNVMDRFVSDKDAAVAKLARAGEVTGEGVRPLSGDVVGDEGFLGLQQALRNRESMLRNIDQASAEALAKKVDVTLEPSAVSPVRTQEIFTEQNQKLLAKAQEAHDGLIKQGDNASGNIMRKAEEVVKNEMDLVEAGVKTAESANAFIANALNAAEADISSRRGAQTEVNKVVRNALESEFQESKEYAKSLYQQLETGGLITTFEKGREVAAKVKGEIPEMDSLPPKIKDFFTTYKGQEKPASELINVLQSFSGAISEQSGPGGNSNTARLLNDVKQGIELDLNELGNLSVDLKSAIANYKIHADKYLNDVSGRVLKGGVYPSQTIEAYATADEGLRQLRLAANAEKRPEVVKAVGDWIYGQMLDSVRANPSRQAIQNWTNSKTGRMLLDVFPEVYESKIAPELAALARAEKSVDVTDTAIKAAKQKSQEVAAITKEYIDQATARANKIKSETQEAAQVRFQDEKKAVQASQAAQYIGAAPESAIGKVLNSDNAVVYMEELVARAAQDPSGDAIEGLKNALKNYLNTVLRRTGEVASTENAIKPLQKADLTLSYDNLNKYLVEKGPRRSSIEMLFGKDSKELAALDKARRQVELYRRRLRAAGGQSVTNLSQMLAGDLDISLAENTLGVLGRLAGAVVPADIKKLTGPMYNMTDLFRGMWRGDVAKKAQGMLVNAMIDPQAAIELLRPVNQQSLPRIKSWLRVYPQSGASLPFNEINSNEQQLPSGNVTTDNFTGYRIVETGKNNFRLYNDRKQLEGVYTSGIEAKRAAVRKAFGSK
jgi:hypothetical protein